MRLSVLISIIILSNGIKILAGDAWVQNYNFGQIFYVEDEEPIEVTFQNDESFDVPNFEVSYSIFQETVPGNWELKYNWTGSDYTVSANSELTITSGTMWTPEGPGRFRLSIESYSPSDINLSNNDLEHDFIAGNFRGVRFKQLNYENPYQIENSTTGMFGIKIPPRDPESGLTFINVLAQKPGTTTNDWIVKNLPIPAVEEEYRLYYYFDLMKIGVSEGEDLNSIDIAIQEDEELMSHAFDPLSWLNFEVFDRAYNVPGDNGETGIVVEEIPDPVEPAVHDEFPGYEHYYVGHQMPNINLDSSKHQPDAEYAGDLNACGPAAAANSIHWLEEYNDNITSTGTSHRDKMEELSGLMERGEEAGVNTRQLARGKLAYIDAHQLPIHVKYQSWWESDSSISSPNEEYGHYAENKSDSIGKTKPPTFEFLKSEVKKGEDVEILFGWYDHGTERHGGHWITVTGFFDSDSLKGIYFKDDGDQKDSTGVRETFIEWQNKKGWGKLVGFDGPNNHCWVESVVSESYDESITFDTEEPGAIFPLESKNENIISLLQNPVRLNDPVSCIYQLKNPSQIAVQLVAADGSVAFEDEIGFMTAGEHTYTLPSGMLTSPGTYFVILRSDTFTLATQLLITD